MKLRAKTSTSINVPGKGLVFVRGPELNDKDDVLEPGEVIDVADDFLVNENVFEVLEAPANGRVKFIKLPERAAPPEPQVVETEVRKLPAAKGGKTGGAKAPAGAGS